METGEYVGKHVKQDGEYDPWAELTEGNAEGYTPKHAKADALAEEEFEGNKKKMVEAFDKTEQTKKKVNRMDDKFEEVKRLIYRMEEGGR